MQLQNNDIEHRTVEIQQLIAANQLGNATKRLQDFVREFNRETRLIHEVIVICNNFNQLQEDQRRRVVSRDEASSTRNDLLFQMLDVIEIVRTSSNPMMAAA